jgi:hypothetical protein
VHIIVELTSINSFPSAIRKMLAGKAYLISKSQQNHCYVITLCICGTNFLSSTAQGSAIPMHYSIPIATHTHFCVS